MVVDRFYNGLAGADRSFLGPRWGLDLGARVVVEDADGRVVVAGPSGYRIAMTRRADGSYVAPVGFDGVLVKTATGWALQRRSVGDVLVFWPGGRLVATRDARARTFSVEYATVGGRSVVSSYGEEGGRRVRFCYSGEGLLRRFEDPASARHRFGYSAGRSVHVRSPTTRSGGADRRDSDTRGARGRCGGPQRSTRRQHPGSRSDLHPAHRLRRVDDEDGVTARYGYDDRGLLSALRVRSGEQVSVQYTLDGRVRSFAAGGERPTRFDYARRPYKTDVRGPDGVRRTYAYDDEWRVTRQYDPDVVPTVRATGELFGFAGRYVRGERAVLARVTADGPDGAGIRSLAVDVDDRHVATVDVACTTTAFDVACPTTAAANIPVDLRSLAEGRHAVRAAARDDEQHRAAGEPWSVTIDRTAPPAPQNLRLERYSSRVSAPVAIFGWDVAADRDLPGGVPGAGVARSEVRRRVNGSGYGPWRVSDEDSIALAGLVVGDVVGLEVRAVDAVGNISDVVSASLEVVERYEDPAVTELAAEAYVEDFATDIETARRWMRTQDVANNVDDGDLGDSVFEASPAHYGGIWFDNTRRRMVVDLTAGASRAAVEDVIAGRGLAEVTDVRAVEFTQRELEEAQPPLEDELADLIAGGLVALARVSSRNAIEIEVASGATTEQRARVDAVAAAAPVRVLVAPVAGPTLGDEDSRCVFPNCDPPVRGGVLTEGLAGVPCTTGFLSRSRSDRRLYMMTAAHCMDDGNTGWVIFSPSGLRIGIGVNHSVIEPADRGDVGLIEIAERVRDDVRPWVFVTKSKAVGPVQTTRNPHYPIVGSARNREGAYVCYNGATSGARCGAITKVNQTFNGRKNMVRVAMCSIDGDSGSPFFKAGRAFGILSGKRTNILKQCVGTFYTGARIAEDLLNVTISG